MRIGILTASFLPQVGGMEWKVHYLATEFTHRGHDVTVFALRHRLGQRHLQLPVTPVYRVIRTGLVARGFGRLGINDHLCYRSVLREHARQPFDVLHCHPLGPLSYCGSRLRADAGIPVVITTSGADVLVEPSMNYGDRLIPHVDRMIRHSLHNCDVVGCISDEIRRVIEEIGTSARLVDIPNGVPWDDFQVPRGDYLRRELNIRDNCLIILTVGRNTPIKDYGSGLRAFAAIHDRFPDSAYVLVGRGVSELRSQARELGISDRLHLIEQVPISDIPRIMHSADIFLNPSLLEGFAQVNAQALASGLPCVLTDSPGNIDAAKHGGALVAKTASPESIATALVRLLENPAERASLSKAAHEAGKHYDWRRIAGQYLDLFEELVDQKTKTLVVAR
jgi:glycosyltransferase involved in cell wall biosynthesis